MSGRPPYRRLELHADAPWLVLVHGATQHCGLFSAQEKHFSTGRNVLLVDLPGHGRAAGASGPFGLVEYAAAVRNVLDEAEIERVHFWGTHTGAAVGLLLAAEEPQRFCSMILEGAVLPGVSMPSVEAAFAKTVLTARSRGVPAARELWFETAPFFDAIRRNRVACRADEHWAIITAFEGGPWVDGLSPAEPPELESALSAITVPTLLVNGELDLDDFITVAALLERGLPDVQRATVPAAGAFPLWERPDLVNALVEVWLCSIDAPPWPGARR
jgi:3-oxoadipate enol-lactonase